MKAKIIYMNSEMEKLSKKHPGDAGIDLRINLPVGCERTKLYPRETKTVGTGIKLDIPPGYGAYVLPRSSMSKNGIHVYTGTIDSGYQGEIKIQIKNLSFSQTIENHERIAQLVFFKIPEVEFEEVTSFDEVSPRGECGFGSTGKF